MSDFYHSLINFSSISLSGTKFHQYQEYIPVPSVDMSVCNSSSHYDGKLDDDVICTGARTDRSPCKVIRSIDYIKNAKKNNKITQ